MLTVTVAAFQRGVVVTFRSDLSRGTATRLLTASGIYGIVLILIDRVYMKGQYVTEYSCMYLFLFLSPKHRLDRS